MFEPGSVFKLVTASAAIENHVVSPGDRFSAENGRYMVRYAGGKLRDITDTKPYGVLTFRQAIEVSSNIVMAKVADRIGAERLYVAARNFGFGTRTGIELPGEAPGELKKPTLWSGATLHSLAFGYEVAATPLQIVAAYGAIANGGLLMKPYIIRRVVDEQGGIVEQGGPQVVRHVASPQTAQLVTEFLCGAVEEGTGREARVAWLPIAGKTGTSRKVVDGKYATGSYTASFVGFFPADHPRVVCLVMLDNPRAGGYTGGVASAPIFRGIAEKVAIRYVQFPATRPPALAGKSRVNVAVRGVAGTVQARSSGSTPGSARAAVSSSVDKSVWTDRTGSISVPDLRGLSVRRAVATLRIRGLDASVSGSGLVVGQDPPPGRRVKPGVRVDLRCESREFSAAEW
jgi:cell division protein FtsI (penicillin-binding protein 3)